MKPLARNGVLRIGVDLSAALVLRQRQVLAESILMRPRDESLEIAGGLLTGLGLAMVITGIVLEVHAPALRAVAGAVLLIIDGGRDAPVVSPVASFGSGGLTLGFRLPHF